MGVRKFRLPSVLALALALCGAASAAGCEPRPGDGQPGKSEANKQGPGAGAPAASPAAGGQGEQAVKTDGGLKALGAGGYSKVLEPFVFVARDEQTYKELRKLVGELPELKEDFFRSNAVVAAFLGQRRSGGYAVEIAREGEGALRVSEKSPPKDSIRTMALTAPYQIVSFPANDEDAVRLRLDPAWQQGQRPYRVVLGEFTMTGGFAGVSEKFNVTGALGLMRYKDLATVLFDLGGDDPRRPRALADVTSGKVFSDKLTLTVDAGTFILPPRQRMAAEVKLGPGENKLHFTLEGVGSKVADGFGGRGEFDAEASAGPPKKIALDDEPM